MKTPLILLAATICVAACKNPDNGAASSQTTTTSTNLQGEKTNVDRGATAPAGLSQKDKDFVTKAAEGGLLEVQLGQVVDKQAQAADVKAFGQRMVSDHTQADNDLKQLAQTKGLALPTQLDSDHQSTFDKMAKLSGPKLDKKYADDMVDDHEEDIKEFQDEAKNGQDPDVKAFAAKTVPILQSHLQEAKDLKAKHK